MIQRRQSLWLLLSTICAFLSYMLPFSSGTEKGVTVILDGGSNFFLLIITGICLIISFITIFMFKDRKLQMKLCITGLIFSIILLIIYFNERNKISGIISLSSVFVFVMPISYILAVIGIRRDEKLIKSLDKLR